jgi:septum site-determining protein MinC
MTSKEPAFKIKTGTLPMLQLHICTTDIEQFKKQLTLRLSQTPDFFANTPVVLDLSAIAELGNELDFVELVSFVREQGMCAVGVVGGTALQRRNAEQAGLALFTDAPARQSARKIEPPVVEAELTGQPELPNINPEVQVVAAITANEVKDILPVPVSIRPTLVIDKPVRTGQSIYAEGADLVVLAIVNAGAELIADGDIHVYAPLRGKAIAGAHGNAAARIFVQSLEAELLSVAGCFKVFEDGIPEEVRGKPAQIHLDGSRLVILPLSQ